MEPLRAVELTALDRVSTFPPAGLAARRLEFADELTANTAGLLRALAERTLAQPDGDPVGRATLDSEA
jgi:hypothetical protein